MPFLIAVLYLIYYHWDRAQRRKAEEAERRKKEKHQAMIARVERERDAMRAFDKATYDAWKRLVWDMDLERKVRLYLLDEKNRSEYEPLLQNIYDTFKRSTRREVKHIPLRRKVTSKNELAADPLELNYGGLWLRRERAVAVALIMAEFGKLPEFYIDSIRFDDNVESEAYAEDVAEYLTRKLSEKYPEEKIGYQMYGTPWSRLGLWHFSVCRWVHNEIVISQIGNPDSLAFIEKDYNKKLQNISIHDRPEDLLYIRNEISRMREFTARRYRNIK